MKKYLIASLLCLPTIHAADSKIDVKINLQCPADSPEYLAFINAVPQKPSPTYEEWQEDFTKSMQALIELVQSGKVRDGHWTANWQPDSP